MRGEATILGRLFPAFAALLIGLLPSQASASAKSEAEFLKAMRAFAEITSGELIGEGEPADKLVFFGRGAGGSLSTIGIQALPLGGDWVEPVKGAIAIMRTRASTSNGNRAPEAADLEQVRRSGIPVFIVGEWSLPPPIWQIVREKGQVRWREIDSAGAPGRWNVEPAAAAASN